MNGGQAKSALASTPFFFKKKKYLSTRHSRVRRGREIMKVIIFRMNGILSHSPKDQPSSKSQVIKKKKTNL